MRGGLIVLVVAATASTALAHGRDATYAAGAPATAGPGMRTIRLMIEEATDGTMTFDPKRIEARPGETIVFRVRNAGKARHEFRIDSVRGNAAHKAMMAQMPGMTHHDENAIEIAPGQEKSLTWRFTKPGTFEFACLIPGHYEAGMHGTVVVTR